MVEKIKIKLLVIGTILTIISVFTIFTTWLATSLWWLISGNMVTRLNFFYMYIILTAIPVTILLFDWVKNIKKPT